MAMLSNPAFWTALTIGCLVLSFILVIAIGTSQLIKLLEKPDHEEPSNDHR